MNKFLRDLKGYYQESRSLRSENNVKNDNVVTTSNVEVELFKNSIQKTMTEEKLRIILQDSHHRDRKGYNEYEKNYTHAFEEPIYSDSDKCNAIKDVYKETFQGFNITNKGQDLTSVWKGACLINVKWDGKIRINVE